VTAAGRATRDHFRVQRKQSSVEQVLECLECGLQSAEARGWKAFLDEELELLVYCAACAEREFGE
jgi:hypothetical protein